MRIYGVAVEPNGARHFVEAGVTVRSAAVAIAGPYADPTVYSLEIANLPSGVVEVTATPGVISGDDHFTSGGGSGDHAGGWDDSDGERRSRRDDRHALAARIRRG